MYQQYWGLRESPFRGGLDASHFFSTANHDEALARLHFLVDGRRRLGLLTGKPGIGKSLLLEIFAQQIHDRGAEVVLLNLIGTDSLGFLWTLAAGCGLNPSVDLAAVAAWRVVADFLIECRYERKQLVVLLDDAEAAHPVVFDSVLRLVQLDPDPDSRLTVILASGEQSATKLHPRLIELAELAITLEPWEQAETATFLALALRRAGRDAPLFTDAAVRRLHEFASGIPLRIKQLADLALLAGAGLELDQIDANTVEDACHELAVIASEPGHATGGGPARSISRPLD